MSKSTAAPIRTSRTIIGPLTTTFTPPAECLTLGAFGTGSGAVSFYRAEGCSNSRLIDATTCWPPASSSLPPSVLNTDANLNGLGIYSPGLACPSGYTTACKEQLDSRGSDVPPANASSTRFQFPLIPNETAVGCCPSGFVCGSNQSGAQSCISTATSTVISAATCGTNAYSSEFPFTFPFTARSTPTSARTTITSVVQTGTAYAPLFQIAFQSSDKPGGPSASAHSAGNKSKKAIGVGAIVGAIIGAIVVLLVLAGAFIFIMNIYRRRRQNRVTRGPGFGDEHDADTLPPYGSRYGDYIMDKSTEPGAMGLQNMSGERGHVEAPAFNEVRNELPAGEPQVRHELPAERMSR